MCKFFKESIRHEICDILGYYAASSGNYLTDLSGQRIGPIFKCRR